MLIEKRLIDANALMDDFRRYMEEQYDREKCVSEENCKVCDRECLWRRIVNKAPTVDAVPVVHGRWVEIPSLIGLPWKVRCDKCGCPQDYKHNYCPNCGAKMDSEVKNENVTV